VAAVGDGDVAHRGRSRRDGGGDEQGGWWVGRREWPCLVAK
jgi:hypothetical protein